MELRDARGSDADGIRRVARESLTTASGAVLDDADVDRLVESAYADDRIAELTADPAATVLVAVDDDVVGFAQGHLVAGDPVVGDIEWLHVTPDDRGRDIGVKLLGELVDGFEDEEAALVRGRVLETNDAAGDVYEAHDFERRGSDAVEIAGERYDEAVFVRRLDDATEDGVLEPVSGPEGESLYVDYSGGERGTEAPFYPVYVDESLTDRWGWRCGNCDSMATTMDGAGRITCSDCENDRVATRWDASYL